MCTGPGSQSNSDSSPEQATRIHLIAHQNNHLFICGSYRRSLACLNNPVKHSGAVLLLPLLMLLLLLLLLPASTTTRSFEYNNLMHHCQSHSHPAISRSLSYMDTMSQSS
jgi:hypothetical protein